MPHLFPSHNQSSTKVLSLLLGAAVALFLILLVPLTQIFRAEPGEVAVIKAHEVAPPPPPPPLTDPPPPPDELEEEPPPELNIPPPMPTLEQLEIGLNPGIGGDLSLGIGLGFNFETESMDQIEKLFGFGELDEVPRLVREGRFRYPANAPRGRGEAFVRLLVYVEVDGRISVQKVIDYSHQEFIDAAKHMAEGSRFSPPMRQGQAVRSRYEWPIRIPLR